MGPHAGQRGTRRSTQLDQLTVERRRSHVLVPLRIRLIARNSQTVTIPLVASALVNVAIRSSRSIIARSPRQRPSCSARRRWGGGVAGHQDRFFDAAGYAEIDDELVGLVEPVHAAAPLKCDNAPFNRGQG